jgi:hypothetical protein
LKIPNTKRGWWSGSSGRAHVAISIFDKVALEQRKLPGRGKK